MWWDADGPGKSYLNIATKVQLELDKDFHRAPKDYEESANKDYYSP